MATNLDLEEQEQLAELKHFWKTYGNLITWLLILVFGAYAAWNGYQYWQRQQAIQAAALFDEVDKAVQSSDPARIERSFGDMKERYGGTTYAKQAALVAARGLQERGKSEAARSALTWVVEQASDDAYRALATLRLVGLLIQDKAYDDALKRLDGSFPAEFAGLVADRKGDVLALQGKTREAATAYASALSALEPADDYRRLVEAKLKSMGQAPAVAVAASKGASQ